MIGVRDTTLSLLLQLKNDVEESYNKSREVTIGGATAAVVGTGLLLSPFTFGASLSLTVAGGVLSAIGSIVMAGAEVGYYAVSKQKINAANEACEVDRKKMEKLNSLSRRFENLVRTVAKKYNTTAEVIVDMALMGGTILRGAYKSAKLVDGAVDAAKAAKKVLTLTGKFRGALTGLSTSVKTTFIIFDFVTIPMDIAVLVKAAYDVHQYNNNGVSNSVRAQEIQILIEQLKEHRKLLIKERDNMNKILEEHHKRCLDMMVKSKLEQQSID